MPGEFDFIEWVRQLRPVSDATPVPVSAGDDLAVLMWNRNMVFVGADQVLDGVHFDSSVHLPRAIGRKAMNRNLSDCAAMACVPAAAVATFALPRGVGTDYAKELYLGMSDAGAPFGCAVVGGDTGSWDGKLAVTVTILGYTTGTPPVTRSRAQPGDSLYVTGPLGGSLLGRHMTFEPRVALAQRLVKTVRLTAMLDLSDGLSRDVRHISRQSGCGAIVFADRVPIHDDAIEMRRDGHSPLEHALHDGEDYELLFTTPDPVPKELATNIGMMVGPADQVLLRNPDGSEEPLVPQGWEHTL